MIGDIVKSLAGITICALLTLIVLKNRTEIYETIGLTPQEETIQPSQTMNVVNQSPKTETRSTGGKVILTKDPRSGQFWTEARINNRKIELLVDTGASSVALTLADAKTAGVRLNSLEYNIPVNTAGGQIMAARTSLKHIKVGSIKVKDVEAFVIPEGLHVSLLGMTYLGAIKKIEVSSDEMVLRN